MFEICRGLHTETLFFVWKPFGSPNKDDSKKTNNMFLSQFQLQLESAFRGSETKPVPGESASDIITKLEKEIFRTEYEVQQSIKRENKVREMIKELDEKFKLATSEPEMNRLLESRYKLEQRLDTEFKDEFDRHTYKFRMINECLVQLYRSEYKRLKEKYEPNNG